MLIKLQVERCDGGPSTGQVPSSRAARGSTAQSGASRLMQRSGSSPMAWGSSVSSTVVPWICTPEGFPCAEIPPPPATNFAASLKKRHVESIQSTGCCTSALQWPVKACGPPRNHWVTLKSPRVTEKMAFHFISPRQRSKFSLQSSLSTACIMFSLQEQGRESARCSSDDPSVASSPHRKHLTSICLQPQGRRCLQRHQHS